MASGWAFQAWQTKERVRPLLPFYPSSGQWDDLNQGILKKKVSLYH
jgi:hypothetical protein